ncbi:Saposin B-type domain-containing protein [Pycnococcus provasolii]|mmetsp:Transcript_13314/g.35330  ORF Transcript_13314/g.35330 Transcript_13314/m.35330 type:complete len:152 (+) Transcript_13314:155-610(+)
MRVNLSCAPARAAVTPPAVAQTHVCRNRMMMVRSSSMVFATFLLVVLLTTAACVTGVRAATAPLHLLNDRDDTPLCEQCQEYAAQVLEKTKEIKNEDQLVDALGMICDDLPAILSEPCKQQIDKNKDAIWDAVKKIDDLTPKELCAQLTLC